MQKLHLFGNTFLSKGPGVESSSQSSSFIPKSKSAKNYLEIENWLAALVWPLYYLCGCEAFFSLQGSMCVLSSVADLCSFWSSEGIFDSPLVSI